MNYEASYDEETDGYTTITNYYPTVDTVNSIVSKVWDDNNNQDGKRPTSIQVQLNADGTPKRSPVTLHEANDWSYTWSGLDKYDAGTENEYTVKEINVPTGYTASYSKDTFVITNTHILVKTTGTTSTTKGSTEKPVTTLRQLYIGFCWQFP